MSKRKTAYPTKRSMNLYYKPDRTTKPATVALYVLFVLVCLLGLSKFLIYDLWAEANEAEEALTSVESQRDSMLLNLTDYGEVLERYSRYSATEEEQTLVDRMEVLALLDEAVGATAAMDSISISDDEVQLQFSGVTLAQTAEIVKTLEASPLVASTMVNTAIRAQNTETGGPVQASVLIQLQKEAS